MTIKLDFKIAQDLINTKLQVLDEKISAILKRWNVETIDQLINSAKSGEFEDAESDAIELQNLVAKREEIEKLYQSMWTGLKYEDLILATLSITQIELQRYIINIELDVDAGRLKIILKNRIVIYIRYNNF